MGDIMIILDKQFLLQSILDNLKELEITFLNYDSGEVYSMLDTKNVSTHNGDTVVGMFFFNSVPLDNNAEILSYTKANILIYAEKLEKHVERTQNHQYVDINDYIYKITAYSRNGVEFNEDPVIIVPVKEELFSRVDGLFETGILSDKKVAIIGLGSGGSPIALELVKSGVQHFVLVDNDRLEIGNVVRHICGISDLGRYKTKAVRDMMLDKNPYAEINTIESAVDWNTYNHVSQMIENVDLVICATDNRESKMIINEICIDKNKVCLYGGAFRRAYGGQVLRVVPRKTICFQCFLDTLPDYAIDTEISSTRQAQNIQYSDVIIPIEPGLSIDISPISMLMTRLAILELLKDKSHTLESLYEDFKGAWYLWLNRREVGTKYEQLIPLEYNVDGLHIMRWYSINIERFRNCPVCGEISSEERITPDELAFFEQKEL